ncbi:MAG TPA: hypothetical protein VKT28_22635 [Puia sp.]|nr:hypothetical protein [Puia sp.]
MLSAILFIFYFIILLLALTAVIKRKKINISFRSLTLIYAYKVLLGCAYGYIFFKFYKGDDTWMNHFDSLVQYQKLIHHPVDFAKDFLPYSAFSASNNFWQGIQYYIWDLEFYSTTKLLSFFNIFSRGNYYINVLFFDSITIIGLLLLYKLIEKKISNKKILIVVLFFMPLTTFWLSGIRTEGLILLLLSATIYYSNKWFNEQKKPAYFLIALIGLIGCIILRAQMLFVFMPAFFSLTLSWKKPEKGVYYFGAIYAACIIIFFSGIFISPENNLSMPVIKRQQEFFRLHGNTSYKLDSLRPSVTSFAKVLPQAFSNTFLRPFVWEAKGALQIFTAIDIIMFWLLLLIAVFYRKKNWREILNQPLFLFFVFYGVSQIVFIGYIVPFPGAIVRYKSIAELFLLLSLTFISDYNRLSGLFQKNDLLK